MYAIEFMEFSSYFALKTVTYWLTSLFVRLNGIKLEEMYQWAVNFYKMVSTSIEDSISLVYEEQLYLLKVLLLQHFNSFSSDFHVFQWNKWDMFNLFNTLDMLNKLIKSNISHTLNTLLSVVRVPDNREGKATRGVEDRGCYGGGEILFLVYQDWGGHC